MLAKSTRSSCPTSSTTVANTSSGSVPRATSVATRRNAACSSASPPNPSPLNASPHPVAIATVTHTRHPSRHQRRDPAQRRLLLGQRTQLLTAQRCSPSRHDCEPHAKASPPTPPPAPARAVEVHLGCVLPGSLEAVHDALGPHALQKGLSGP